MSGTTETFISHPLGILTVILFAIGLVFVILEEITHIKKSKVLMVTSGLSWLLVAIKFDGKKTDDGHSWVAHSIEEYLVEYTQLFLFLLAAMTFVNAMSSLGLFNFLREWIINKRLKKRAMFWLTGCAAFLLSPIADNLTTALILGETLANIGGIVTGHQSDSDSDFIHDLGIPQEKVQQICKDFGIQYEGEEDTLSEDDPIVLAFSPGIELKSDGENSPNIRYDASFDYEAGTSREFELQSPSPSLSISVTDSNMLNLNIPSALRKSSSCPPNTMTDHLFDTAKMKTLEMIKDERAADNKFVAAAISNVVIAANAGGAFSPFGDVTTLMVWQAQKASFTEFFALILPSLVNWIIPAFFISLTIKGKAPRHQLQKDPHSHLKPGCLAVTVLFILTITFTITCHNLFHLPACIGMMFGLGALSLLSFFIKKRQKKRKRTITYVLKTMGYELGDEEFDEELFEMFHNILPRTEWDSLLFFYSIIMSVGALAKFGYLEELSSMLYGDLGPTWASIIFGIVSAVIDNIPCMVAVLDMNPADMTTTKDWLLITLTTGTGGSLLAFGSAAGVVAISVSRGVFSMKSHFKYFPVIFLGYAASVGLHLLIN
ncbi:hypothetical protein PCE1_001862 [Barthelona sp. PCE]